MSENIFESNEEHVAEAIELMETELASRKARRKVQIKNFVKGVAIGASIGLVTTVAVAVLFAVTTNTDAIVETE